MPKLGVVITACLVVVLLETLHLHYVYIQNLQRCHSNSRLPSTSDAVALNGIEATRAAPLSSGVTNRIEATRTAPVSHGVIDAIEATQAVPLVPGLMSYSDSMKQLQAAMKESTYRFDRARNLPLMNLAPEQQNRTFRIAEGKAWLKTQKLVVAATVRNAMNGLKMSVESLRTLGTLFHSVTAVFVENDSTDGTRSYLHDMAGRSTDQFKVILLGCGEVNSAGPCHLNISYGSSGREHRQGHLEQAKRSMAEESVDRGLVMAALRNLYLRYIYDNIQQADLLFVLEADLRWKAWDLDSIVQGLYHFKAKPQLDSLCAFTMLQVGIFHDPCTFIFHHNKLFYVDSGETQFPFIDRIGKKTNKLFESIYDRWSRKNDDRLPPVKVASCFQGAAFYRMSSLRSARALYRYSDGEWHCEHSTLSKQLMENYFDTEMRLEVASHVSG